ncbi:alkyl sulfatase dimerization domain-containing protein [Ottowia sp.]|uniref:alkyl/aryl-sulfatase n=1 Tax=Ottowia sp. TaxID=1898956 RepID=UPI002B838111|nr:alkyl sulfatase dimerization domain-containing protein [Ottowia sp.]HNR84147.1 alkyl sulfatase dimerization domain-containing protein [Ottowia sp.]HNT85679.1 alkyl sulfatase dimerization domain-containing protein [Ottowia sp.]
MASQLPPEDGEDAADAQRGFIATLPDAEVRRADGGSVWSQRAYGFLDDEQSPDTVHPGLWRQARLNRVHGLFQVTARIFQVRGLDIANITFIEGDEGLIAVDALTCAETAAAALALYRKHRDPLSRRPLHTVIYTHSHADHFGGVHGLVDEADVRAGRVQVIAPAGFLHHAVAENVLAGVAMARRSQFQFGQTLPKGPAGQVDAGLGKTLPLGRPGLIAPTREIAAEHEVLTIDGLAIEFQLTPETEAPAEMHLFIASEGALNLAENATHTLHNLCPLRGAQVRDALAWSKYLNQALHRYGPRTEVVLAQHHWPTWGRDRACRLLAEQRDLYRLLHDQTVRLMSHGLKAAEIAEGLQLPPALAARWHTRGFYGTVSHNVKAIYQHYLSWYDANPANLHALPPVEAARKTVAYMGGADALLARARDDFARGEFRWVAEVMKQLVYAQPDLAPARELAAAALEQMGFQAESATWRNAFLLGAREYRDGPPPPPPAGAGMAMLGALDNELLFDALAVRVHAGRAEGLAFTLAWHFTDRDELWLSTLSHGALSSLRIADPAVAAAADLRITTDRPTLDAILQQRLPPPQAVSEGRLQLQGQAALLPRFFGLLDRFSGSFAVVDAAPWPL